MEQKKKKKRSQKPSSLFLRVFLLVFVGAVSVGIGKQALHYQELQEELTAVATQIEKEEERQLEFEGRKEYYTSDSYIEQVAREQLGMVKPNEVLFINRSE